MANKYENTQLVVKGIVTGFKYDAPFSATIKNVNKYLGAVQQDIAKSGSSVDIKVPVRAISKGNGSTDSSYDRQDVYVETKPFALTSFSKAHFDVTLEEQTLDLDSLKEDIIMPSKQVIVEGKEEEHSQVILRTGNCIVAGSLGATISDLSKMKTRLKKLGVPFSGDAVSFLSPSEIHDSIVDNTSNFFNPTKEISRGWYKGNYDSGKQMKFMTSELLPIHTNGSANSGVYVSATGLTPVGLVATTSTNGDTTLAIDTITTDGTITAGTTLSIAGVNASRTGALRGDAGMLFQVAVKATETSAAGAVTVTLEDKFNDGSTATSASLKNVTALPQDGAVVYMTGKVDTQYEVGVAYHKDAYMVGYCDMSSPEGRKHTKFTEYGGSMGIKGICIYDYDYEINKNIFRTDCFSGTSILRPEFACKIYQEIV